MVVFVRVFSNLHVIPKVLIELWGRDGEAVRVRECGLCLAGQGRRRFISKNGLELG